MSKKAIVFGKGGQLGTELVSVFKQRGWQVIAFDRSAVDVTDADHVATTIASESPAVVLNATAYNMVDVAEKEPAAAYAGNALAVRNLAIACRQAEARLVHFSTDYVFDGRKGAPYVESDTPHPLGAYGVSKLAGELYARAYLESPLIIRTSGVFGPGAVFNKRGNFVETMLRLAQSGQPIRVVQDHIASPTYSPALAERTADLVERQIGGVLHIGGGAPVSWFSYAEAIFQVAGISPELRPTSEQEYRTAAKRPQFSALSNAKMETLGLAPMPDLRYSLEEYMDRRAKLLSKDV